MNIETVHNMLITIHNSVTDKDVSKILGTARLQLETILVKNSPPLNDSEVQLPTKLMRVNAYKDRTGVSTTLAHAVVNSAWRDAQRIAGKDERATSKWMPYSESK